MVTLADIVFNHIVNSALAEDIANEIFSDEKTIISFALMTTNLVIYARGNF